MNKETTIWKWRDDELSVKEFYNLTSTAKQEYITSLEQIEAATLSSGDNILLNLYSKKRSKQFLNLNNDEDATDLIIIK